MKNFIQAIKELQEEKPGLWANIRAKRARGEKPAHKNSNAHKDAVKAGKKINKEGLWANINAKKKAGKKPSHGNSNAHKQAEKAGKALGKESANPQDGKAAPYGSGYKKVTKEDIRRFVISTIAEMENNTKKPATYAGRPVIVHMNGPETEWKVEILGNGKIVDYIDMMANLKFDDGTTYMDYLKEDLIQEEEVKSGKKK